MKSWQNRSQNVLKKLPKTVAKYIEKSDMLRYTHALSSESVFFSQLFFRERGERKTYNQAVSQRTVIRTTLHEGLPRVYDASLTVNENRHTRFVNAGSIPAVRQTYVGWFDKCSCPDRKDHIFCEKNSMRVSPACDSFRKTRECRRSHARFRIPPARGGVQTSCPAARTEG